VRGNGTQREPLKVFFSISSSPGYLDSVVLPAGLPGADTTVTFAAWSATPGSYAARCSVYLATDQVRANDTVGLGFTVSAIDVGVTAITSPTDSIDTLDPVVPAAVVRNYGATAASFRAWLAISGPGTDWADSVLVLDLASGDSAVAVFRSWPGPRRSGQYFARCSVWVASDSNALNDTLGKSFIAYTAPPPLPPGWLEVAQVPLSPSGRAVKDGGWLAWDAASGEFVVAKGHKTGDLYSFDPATGSLTARLPWPVGNESRPPSKGAVGVGDGSGSVYAVKGNNTVGFWRYDIVADGWEQLPDVPLGMSNKRVKGGSDLAYVTEGDSGYVYLLKGYRTEFYRYSIGSGRWQTLADAPAGARPKWDKGSWLAYDGTTVLYAHKAKYHELYAFDVAAGTWGAVMTGMPLVNSQTGRTKKSKDGGDAALLGGLLYALKGGNTQDFYSFEPATQAWAEKETVPAYGTTGRKKRVKSGGSIASDGIALYALKGNKTLELWRYVPSSLGAGPVTPSARAATQGARRETPEVEICVQSPAHRAATVRWSAPSSLAPHPSLLSVYDASGRLILTRSLDLAVSRSLRLPPLSPGIYVIRVSGAVRTTGKLVVQ
jgi:hypothetical protein